MPSTRSSYQEGSLDRVHRAKGPDVWIFRWRELQPDGSRVQRKKVIGDVGKYPKLAAARRAVENLRAEINAQKEKVGRITIAEAWGHFQAHELRDADVDRAQSTINNYLDLFRAHIIPKWGDVFLDDVKAVTVEKWLRSLKSLAPASRAKIKSRMHTLFAHAKRHELCERNPIEDVRQGSKRVRKSTILTIAESKAILANISTQAVLVAVLVAPATGFRRSEIRGLKWKDIDFENAQITLERGSIRKHVSALKNRSSGATVPILEALVVALQQWRKETLYRGDEDWIFASPATSGGNPLWFDSALVKQLKARSEEGRHLEARDMAHLQAFTGQPPGQEG